MPSHKPSISAFFCFFLVTTGAAFASTPAPIEFFASNNTQKIDSQTAYLRLQGDEQRNLQNSMLQVLQKNHFEQGRFDVILGEYNHSADNTEKFSASPYQILSNETIFSLARQLAIKLEQESVAVFIPNTVATGEINVHFTSHQPGVAEFISLIHDKLPAAYSQAFSLHLVNTCGDFNKAKVSEVEWLGSKIQSKEIQTAFPLEKIHSTKGKAYLIYQNGQKEEL